MGWSCRRSAKQAGQQGDQGHADQGDAAARDKLFYPQIGVKPCSMAGGGVSKNIWNCFRTAPEGLAVRYGAKAVKSCKEDEAWDEKKRSAVPIVR